MSTERGHSLVELSELGLDPGVPKQELRRLITPKSVCEYRALLASKASLPEGLILDPAAGSGGQLLAYGKYISKHCVGVELSPERAKYCGYVLSRGNSTGSFMTICGDGIDAHGVMAAVKTQIGVSSVSMLHVDPARPMDTQKHSVSEMQPPLAELLESWSEYISSGEQGPAMALDLSPRLAGQQMSEIEHIVTAIFPGTAMTWEWLSRGGGRVDRLCLHTGPLAHTPSVSKSVRLYNDGSFSVLHAREEELDSEDSGWPNYEVMEGDTVALVDPVVTKSRLRGVFEDRLGYNRGELIWAKKSDRRPLVVLREEIRPGSEARPFVMAQGKAVGRLESDLSMMSIDSLAALAMENGISNIQIRCSCEPQLHKRITNRLSKIMGSVDGMSGFLIEDGGTKDLMLCRDVEK